MHLLVRWLVHAGALAVVAGLFPGIRLKGFGSAMIAAAIIGLLNVTLGVVLHFLALPITFLTLGLFALVINAFLFWLAGALLSGFDVEGKWTALFGSIVYTFLAHGLLHLLGHPAATAGW